MQVLNPWTGEVFRELYPNSSEDLNIAIERAQAAAGELARSSRQQKAKWCQEVISGLQARKQEFVELIVSEAGKPIKFAEGEVARALSTFRLASQEALREHGEMVPLDIEVNTGGYLGFTQRVPCGPVAAITPFNFPLNLVAHKVAPALAVGNPIILKPAPDTPLTALLLAEVIAETSLPEGAFSCLLLDIPTTQKLLSDPRIKFISFTGSAKVGWQIKADNPQKKVALELGGNAAAVVCEDCDLDWVAERLAVGGYAYAGQVCISVQRIYVDSKVYEPFRERFLDAVGRLKVGDPLDPDTVVGPLIRPQELNRLDSWVQEAVSQGAHLLLGGKVAPPCYLPTVLENVSSGSKVSCQEVFGPITTLEPFDTFEEALMRVNDSVYGLQAGVFTNDINRALEAHRILEVGAVIVNDYPTFRVDSMPYGGVKESGFGREGVRYTMEEMTEPRLLVIRSS